MFIMFPHCDGFDVLVNVSRIMWAAPMSEDGKEFTRLYMNVADNKGGPAELDISISIEELDEELEGSKEDQ